MRWSRSGFPAESWLLELRRRGAGLLEGERERESSPTPTYTHPSQQREALFPYKVEKLQKHRNQMTSH